MTQPLLLALTLAVIALAGCGSTSSSSTSGAASATTPSSTTAPTKASGSGSPLEVAMKNLAFSPTSITAKVGQTVQWTNHDSPPHNVVYVSGPKFASSSTINTGATFTLKLTHPGTIHYICSIHPFMKATIIVTK